jgi:hypothetical protein
LRPAASSLVRVQHRKYAVRSAPLRQSYAPTLFSTHSIVRTNCCEFAPDVYDHDHKHDQCDNMREPGCTLENDCVCQLNRPRVALRLGEMGARNRRRRADQRTQRNWCAFAYRGEVAEAHGGGGGGRNVVAGYSCRPMDVGVTGVVDGCRRR